MKKVLFSGFFTLAIIAQIILLQACRVENQAPNFLVILVDDLGIKDLGCYGQQIIQTPNPDHVPLDIAQNQYSD